MDHKGVDFIFVHTHQDGTAISAFVFDRRIMPFQHLAVRWPPLQWQAAPERP
jgi:hypothetical protein